MSYNSTCNLRVSCCCFALFFFTWMLLSLCFCIAYMSLFLFYYQKQGFSQKGVQADAHFLEKFKIHLIFQIISKKHTPWMDNLQFLAKS